MSMSNDETELALLLQPAGASAPYTSYTQLDKQTRTIRLLHIKLDSNHVQATVMTTTLDDPTAYDALSYCWGPPDHPKTIYIDHEAVPIRSSLYDFLYVLCQQGQSLPVWVDSICIDQRNVDERNWQVSLMGDIYRCATRVKCWLGPSDAYSDYAFAYAHQRHQEKLLSSGDLSRIQRTASSSIRTLLDRNYWKRLWIVQEMALAKELLLACGNNTASWETFLEVVDSLRPDHKHVISSIKNLRENIHKLAPLLHKFPSVLSTNFNDDSYMFSIRLKALNTPGLHGWLPKVSLVRQMMSFSAQACEEPKDRIFALLNVAMDGDKITVDYTKSLADTIMDVVMACYLTCLSRLNGIEDEDRHRNRDEDGHENSPPKHNPSTEPVRDAPFFRFLAAAAACLVNFGVEYNFRKYLTTLSSTQDCAGMMHQLDARDIALLYSNDGISHFLSGGYLGDLVFSEWDSCKKSPLLGAFTGFSTTCNSCSRCPDYADVRGVYSILVRLGHIQLCARASLGTKNGRGCRFFVHYTRLAILALLFVTAAVRPMDMISTLKEWRPRCRKQKLCNCRVSAEANREAFIEYERLKSELLQETKIHRKRRERRSRKEEQGKRIVEERRKKEQEREEMAQAQDRGSVPSQTATHASSPIEQATKFPSPNLYKKRGWCARILGRQSK